MSCLNQGAGRLGLFNGARLLVPVLYAGTLVGLVLTDTIGVRPFAVAYVGSWAVALVVLLLSSERRLRRGVARPRVDVATVKLSWAVGHRAYLGSLAPVDSLQLDVLATTAVLGAREAGLYYVGTSVGALVRAWGTTLGALALPRVAAATSRGVALSLLGLYARGTLLLSGAFAVVVFVFADRLLVLVYGEQFAAAAPLVRILAVGMLAASLRYVIGDGLRGLGAHAQATRAEMGGWVVGGVAIVVLLPLWGVNGVALAVSISYVSTLAAMLWLCARAGAKPATLLVVRLADLRGLWTAGGPPVSGSDGAAHE